jgi:copper homeostasis protein
MSRPAPDGRAAGADTALKESSLGTKLEIEALAASAEDCAAAARAGADRVELFSSPGTGGLTPSPGTVSTSKALAGLPVMAMLRPRRSGFAYSKAELAAMALDSAALRAAGADGLVFGALKEDGRVDAAACELVMAGAPDCREWTFHRAFDLVPEALAALEELCALGFSRVLTKGCANSFEEGEELLLRLREAAAGRIRILVPGVRPHNVERIVAGDGFDQIHLGRFALRTDPSNSARPGIFFGADSRGREGEYEALDEAYVRDLVASARSAYAGRATSAG